MFDYEYLMLDCEFLTLLARQGEIAALGAGSVSIQKRTSTTLCVTGPALGEPGHDSHLRGSGGRRSRSFGALTAGRGVPVMPLAR